MRRYFSTGRQGLVAAMEEEAAVVAEQELETLPVEVAETAAEATEATADVQEEAAIGEEMDVQRDEAVETVEALESIAVALEASAANGGLDKHSANVVGICLESMYARVGLRAIPMPALESFGGTSSRIGATQLALEGVKEQAKKIWEAIVAAIKKAAEWVMNFFSKIFGGTGHLKSHAEALKKQLGTIDKGAKPNAVEIENPKLAEALQTAGKVDVGSIENGVMAVHNLVGEVFEKADNSKLMTKDIIAAAEKLAASPKNAVDIINTIRKAAKDFTSAEMPGGKVYVVKLGASFGEMETGVVDSKGAKFSGGKLKTLSVKEAENIVATIEAIVTMIEHSKEVGKELAAEMNKVSDAAKKSMKEIEDNPEHAEHAGIIKTFYGKSAKLLSSGYASLSSYSLKTGNSALQYVSESLKQYGAKKEEAAKPEADASKKK